ncbi:hypothetical protein ACRHK7_01720 [Weissella tructae]|uniref:Uncharacterized protein n=2 Tax=Weissella TaxID=46255 RepID=A0A075U031_9LACO|nr:MULTISPECIES: hypothetical protein [Weissella]AIG65890.1 hypothetical protein WS08_0951 [Weissella tructae]AIM63269.1 hypothetical protein WS74_1017 [Weissella ceti]AIM64603.1 hypothetical protein WS105_1013 [Weissella ceti]ELA07261.1 hypothetical protein WCNC_02352 [Weissella ceti NC36]QVV91049.1 hypothetical protein KHQ32_05330 [Weissella tructae]
MKLLTKFAFAIKPYIQTVWFLIIFGGVILSQFFFRTPLTTFLSMTLVLLLVMVNLLTVTLTKQQRTFYYVILGLYALMIVLEIAAWFA